MVTKKGFSQLAIILVALAIPATASADLIVTLQPTTRILTVGESSFFDVFVTGTLAAGDPISAYNITLLDAAGVNYTGVTTTTLALDGYIFSDGDGLNVTQTNPDVKYVDVSESGPTNVTTDETFGAGRIFFDAVAAGDYTINFDTPISSSFIRDDATEIPATFTGASITILPAAVPEPTTTLLLILTGVGGLFFARFRRRSSPEPVAG